MKRIVIALGGNALGEDYLEQQILLKKVAEDLSETFKNNEVIITHGNGPQVGVITKAFANSKVDMPLDVCTAMSQGYIGFHLQKQIRNILDTLKIDKEVISVVSEVVVDENDSSFNNKTKPIGKFYAKEEAETLSKESGDEYKEDAGRGYRKVVASPMPIKIKNVESIKTLLNNNTIVIAGGGGGIPVFEDPESTKVEAVIDKDVTSALLASELNADMFIILTAVDQVMLNFGKENEIKLNNISVKEAYEFLETDEFKSGSMRPKIEAALMFTEKTGGETIITSLENVNNIISKENVTVIHK